MRFWKIFSCSFEWDQRKIFSPNRVKDMSLQSYKGKTQNSTTTTAAVIWHFLAKFQFTSGFLAKIIKLQQNSTKKIDILIFISISLKITAWQSGIGQTPEKNDFYCTLRYHCNAIFEGNWTKFMSFWKIFSCSFEWDQRKIFSPNRVKDMSLQSYEGKTRKSTTTTTAVIWHFLSMIPIYFWFYG